MLAVLLAIIANCWLRPHYLLVRAAGTVLLAVFSGQPAVAAVALLMIASEGKEWGGVGHKRPVVVEGIAGSGRSAFLSRLSVPTEAPAPSPSGLIGYMASLSRHIAASGAPQMGSWCSLLASAEQALKPDEFDAFICLCRSLVKTGALVIPSAAVHTHAALEACAKRTGSSPETLGAQLAQLDKITSFYKAMCIPVIPATPMCDALRAYNTAVRLSGSRPSNDAILEAMQVHWPDLAPKAKVH